MRVKCTSNNENGLAITVNQIYDVLEVGDTCYTIVNDRGNNKSYLFRHFEVVEDAPVVVANNPPEQPAVVDNPVNVSRLFAVINGDLNHIISSETLAGIHTIFDAMLKRDEFKDGDVVTIYNGVSGATYKVRSKPYLVNDVVNNAG